MLATIPNIYGVFGNCSRLWIPPVLKHVPDMRLDAHKDRLEASRTLADRDRRTHVDKPVSVSDGVPSFQKCGAYASSASLQRHSIGSTL